MDTKAQKYVTDALSEIAKASTQEELTALGEVFKGKPAPIQNALRGAYKTRQQQLKEQEAADELAVLGEMFKGKAPAV